MTLTKDKKTTKYKGDKEKNWKRNKEKMEINRQKWIVDTKLRIMKNCALSQTVNNVWCKFRNESFWKIDKGTIEKYRRTMTFFVYRHVDSLLFSRWWICVCVCLCTWMRPLHITANPNSKKKKKLKWRNAWHDVYFNGNTINGNEKKKRGLILNA